MISNYDKRPSVETGVAAEQCRTGWDDVCEALAGELRERDGVLCVECYPGVDAETIASSLRSRLDLHHVFFSESAMLDDAALRARFDRDLTNDPVFGQMTHAVLPEFFDKAKLQLLQEAIRAGRGKSSGRGRGGKPGSVGTGHAGVRGLPSMGAAAAAAGGADRQPGSAERDRAGGCEVQACLFSGLARGGPSQTVVVRQGRCVARHDLRPSRSSWMGRSTVRRWDAW